MGLREKVTLVLIAVVFYETVCSLCVQQSAKENLFEKYLNKLKNGKSRTVSKYEIEQNKKSQRLKDDFHKQNVLKTYSFPEVDFPSDHSPKVNSGGISSIDVLSDSALLNELRKEKRRKRKNKQTEKIYSRDDLPVATMPDSFRYQEPTTYFTEMGSFPEVQYPLTAADTWSTNFWNPLPSDKVDDHLKSNYFISQNKKQLKKDIEALLKPSAIKQNQKILKDKEGSTIINQKNLTNVKDEKILKETLGSFSIKPIDNTKISKKQAQKLEIDTKMLPKEHTAPKRKVKPLKKNISETHLTSKKHSKKVISESTSSRSRSTLFPRVEQLSNKTNNICSSDNNTTSCIDSNKANANNLSSKEVFISNIQKKELLNDVERSRTDSENNVPEKFTIEDYNGKPIDDVPLPSLTNTTSTIAFEDLFSKENVKNDLSREIISEVPLDDVSDNPNNDYFLKNSTKDELVEKKFEALVDSTLADNISNDTHDIDSTKLQPLLTDMDSESPVESFPAYPTSSLTNLQSNEVSDYQVSLSDDSVRQRIIDVLSTEKLSVSSLKENILKIILNEAQLPRGISFESQLNNITANEEISESPSDNALDKNILEIPVIDNSLTDVIDTSPLFKNPSNNDIKDILSASIPSDDIVEFSINIADNSSEISSETSMNNTVGNITTEDTETISNDTIEVLSMVSKEVDAETIVSEALADNLREIISKPSNSRALVDDLREIIRLLTIWNSQIDDSDEVINNISETVTNADNFTKISSDPSNVIIYDLSVKNRPIEDSTKLIPVNNDLHSRIPTTDLIQMVGEAIAEENDRFDETTTIEKNKLILDTRFNETFPEDSAIVIIQLSEDPADDSSVSITKKIDNKNTTTDSSGIILNSTDSKNNITSTEKLKSDSREIISESAANDAKDILTVNFAIDSSETISEALNSDKDTLAEIAQTSLDLTDSKTLTEKPTTDYIANITGNLFNNSDTFIENTMIDSGGITPHPIVKDITDDLTHNDFPADDSNSRAYTHEPIQIADEMNPVFKYDKALTDDLSETISDNISFKEFPSPFTFGDVISSLAKETESDIPISFISTDVPSPLLTNPVVEKVVPEVDEHFENVCPIIDENSFKNQCFIFEEPDYFNLTSNLTDIITGKLLLTSVEEFIDSLPDNPLSKSKLTNVTLTDLIMGYEYISNHTTKSQDKTTKTNVPDTGTMLSDDEIPDFSDYASSPEDDTNSDFFDNTLFNVNETCRDQFSISLSVNNTGLNCTDNSTSNKVQDEPDISYTFNEYAEPTDDLIHLKTDVGLSYETVPENVSKDSENNILQDMLNIETTERAVAPQISSESTTGPVSNKFVHDFEPEDSNTFNDTAITPDETEKVYIDHIKDLEKVDESDPSNEFKDGTTSTKSETGSIHESVEYDTVPLDFTVDESYGLTDEIVPDEPNIDTLDPPTMSTMTDKSADNIIEKSDDGTSQKSLEDDTAPEEFYANNGPANDIKSNNQPNKVLYESVFDTTLIKSNDSDIVLSAEIPTNTEKGEIKTVFNVSKVTQTDELVEEIVLGESNTDIANGPADVIESETSDINTSKSDQPKSNPKNVTDDILDDFYGSGDSETLTDETHAEVTSTSNIPSDKFDPELLSGEFIFEKALDTTNVNVNKETAKVKPSIELALHEAETDQISFKPTDIIAIDKGNDPTRELTNDITEPDESGNITRLNDSMADVSSEQNENYLLLDEPIDRSKFDDADDLDKDLNPNLQLNPYDK